MQKFILFKNIIIYYFINESCYKGITGSGQVKKYPGYEEKDNFLLTINQRHQVYQKEKNIFISIIQLT